MAQKKLSDDTCRCASYNCPNREKCLRYTYRGSEEYVPYSTFWETNEQGECKFFIKG